MSNSHLPPDFDPRATSGAHPHLTLDQFLKREGMAATGGHAKMLIQGGEVQVNGEVETRRGRKLKTGDVVLHNGQSATVELPLD